MFLFVNNFKMIGMLLNNATARSVSKKLTKTYKKGFPNHSSLTMIQANQWNVATF